MSRRRSQRRKARSQAAHERNLAEARSLELRELARYRLHQADQWAAAGHAERSRWLERRAYAAVIEAELLLMGVELRLPVADVVVDRLEETMLQLMLLNDVDAAAQARDSFFRLVAKDLADLQEGTPS